MKRSHTLPLFLFFTTLTAAPAAPETIRLVNNQTKRTTAPILLVDGQRFQINNREYAIKLPTLASELSKLNQQVTIREAEFRHADVTRVVEFLVDYAKSLNHDLNIVVDIKTPTTPNKPVPDDDFGFGGDDFGFDDEIGLDDAFFSGASAYSPPRVTISLIRVGLGDLLALVAQLADLDLTFEGTAFYLRTTTKPQNPSTQPLNSFFIFDPVSRKSTGPYPVRNGASIPIGKATYTVLAKTLTDLVNQLDERVLIRELEFKQAGAKAAFDFLRSYAHSHRQDLPLVIDLPAGKPNPLSDIRITVALKDVRLGAAVKIIAELSDLELRLEKGIIIARPKK